MLYVCLLCLQIRPFTVLVSVRKLKMTRDVDIIIVQFVHSVTV